MIDDGTSLPGRHSDQTLQLGQADPLLAALRLELAAEYDVERELGRGGMAVVYKALERELHRTVALKVLPPGVGGANMAERFKREARLAAALDHPNIIPVYRVGQAAGTFFFAMKFVEGRAVDAIIESQGALPIPVALQLLRASASALAFAHDRGIIHRDIKGANILVDRDGRVMVSDFGIARAAEEKTLTASGSVIGTPHFMSPEQCSGAKVGPQSDQYSLGVLAFQMLTGSVPFDADSLMAILQHHFFTPVPDIANVRDGVPPLLISIINRMLAKDAAHRFATTRELVAELEQVPFADAEKRMADEMLQQLAIGVPVPRVRTGSLPPLQDTRLAGMSAGATSTAPTQVAASPAKRKSKLPMIAALVTVIAAAGGVAAWQMQRRAADAEQRRASAAAAESTQAENRRLQQLHDDSLRNAAQSAVRDSAKAADSLRSASSRRPPPGRATQQQPPVTTPAPAPVGDPGSLRVSASRPDADIFVDNRRLAQGTVVDEPVPPGRHTLRITAPGCQAYTEAFTVQAATPVNLGRKTLQCQ